MSEENTVSEQINGLQDGIKAKKEKIASLDADIKGDEVSIRELLNSTRVDRKSSRDKTEDDQEA